MDSYYPNFLPGQLRAVLLRIDPKPPLRGGHHMHQRDAVIIGFKTLKDGALEAVMLTPRMPDEVLMVADLSGREPTWTLLDSPAPARRWTFDKWSDVHEEVQRRFEAAQVPKEEPQAMGPSLGPVPGATGLAGGIDGWRGVPRPQKPVSGPNAAARARSHPRDAQ